MLCYLLAPLSFRVSFPLDHEECVSLPVEEKETSLSLHLFSFAAALAFVIAVMVPVTYPVACVERATLPLVFSSD